MDATRSLIALFADPSGFAGFAEETIKTMMPPRPRVVQEPLKRDADTRTLTPPEPISEDTAREIFAGSLVKVAGPEPIKGGAFVLVACMVAGLLAIAYSIASAS